MTQKRNIVVGIITIATVVGLILAYLLFPSLNVEEEANGILIVNPSVVASQSTEQESDLRFDLANYALIFEKNIDTETQETITADIEALINGRVVDFVSNRDDRRLLEVKLGDDIATRIFTVDYTPESNIEGFGALLSLYDEPPIISRTFESIYEYKGRESIYLPSQLVDIYEEQIAFKRKYRRIFLDLDNFLFRLRNLESEKFTQKTIQDLGYRSESRTLVDVVNAMDMKAIIDYQNNYSRDYADISLLNVVPINRVFENATESLQMPENTILAQIDVYNSDNNPNIFDEKSILVVYIRGKWHIWHPYI